VANAMKELNAVLTSNDEKQVMDAANMVDSLKQKLRRDLLGQLTTNAELLAGRFFATPGNPHAVIAELGRWINGMPETSTQEKERKGALAAISTVIRFISGNMN
jgi:hypothetical protein